jgi:uncharacterized protein YgbK (DUF1537 family)
MTGVGPERLLAWYGDDFTGAAAVMEVMAFAGVPAVLFIDPPTAADMAAFPRARAIGIAGSARAQTPEWMDRELPAIFGHLRGIGAEVTLYKICSTLDSAPDIGSIGRAIELGLRVFPADIVPVMPAAPPIGRWQAFGTLFARGADGIHRLDRHPVMARHPVTPMSEADVARHLAAQTDLPVACLMLPDLAGPDGGATALAALQARGARLVTLDCAGDQDLARIGALLSARGGLVAGSQGVAYALVAHQVAAGLLPSPASEPVRTAPADRVAVVSGSVSSVTADQIAWAEAHGFGLVALDPVAVLKDTAPEGAECARVAAAALAILDSGRSVLVHSARGPDDPRLPAFRAALARSGLDEATANARIGAALGDVLLGLWRQAGLTRLVASGGDTSGHVARRLGLRALTALAETVPGAALCTGHLPGGATVEIALKGGQMGTTDYFGRIRSGGRPEQGDDK